MSFKITIANLFIVLVVILLGAIGLTTASYADPLLPSQDVTTFGRTHP